MLLHSSSTSDSVIAKALSRLHEAPLAKPRVSFEFFPPKTEEMEEKLWQSITKLEGLKPEFVSVTYGAGGSTRERTHKTVARILHETSLKPAAHLTCVNATRKEVDAVAQEYWDLGVRHIVALRGDAVGGTGPYQPYPGGYAYAADLVKGLKNIGDFEISVAAYPEMHPEAVSADMDLDYLKRKIDAGATRAITQYFFNADYYFRFMDKAEKAGITVPIVPGIVPIQHINQILKFSAMCGTEVPKWIRVMLENLEDDPETHRLLAAIIAADQCQALTENGVEQLHFYTLNHANLTFAVCRLLGLQKA